MDTIKIGPKLAKIIAHRGLSGIEQENTCAAFVAAGNRSYLGIETDVHKTLDGEFVIIHDDTTTRVSNGKVNIDVERVTYHKIQEVCLPDKNGKIRQDLRIPLLCEYVRICKQYDKVCVIELKNGFCREDIQRIIEIIRREDYLKHVIFISFVLENCILLRQLLPEQEIQWLIGQQLNQQIVDTLVQYNLELDIAYPFLTNVLVSELHEKGILVNCWTCDEKQEAEKLLNMGIDYLTTNILE